MLTVGNWSEKTFLIFAFLSCEAFKLFVEFSTCLYSIPVLQTALKKAELIQFCKLLRACIAALQTAPIDVT